MNFSEFCKKIISEYPEYVNQNTACEICGVCLSTLRKLEKNGKIPFEYETDGHPNVHRIKVIDLLRYLYDKENPQESETEYIKIMRKYYEKQFSVYPDVLRKSDVEQMTGYARTAVLNWVDNGLLEVRKQGRAFLFYKNNVIDFMMGDYYNSIPRRSEKQSKDLEEIKRLAEERSMALKRKKCREIEYTNEFYNQLLIENPEHIDINDLCRICHISKRRAVYLLNRRLIPCTQRNITSTKHTYRIAMTDVIEYLKNRQINPIKYDVHYSAVDIPLDKKDLCGLRKYFNHLFEDKPDVLSLAEAAEITGYNEKTVRYWINAGKFKAFKNSYSYLIPKISLLDYMVSDEYLTRNTQNGIQLEYLEGYKKWK